MTMGPEACKAPTSCADKPVPICPFVAICPTDNTAFTSKPALLKGAAEGACLYEKCQEAQGGGDKSEAQGTAGSDTAPAPATPVAGGSPSNAAQLAAPAVIMLTLVVVLVEALLNCC
jgi:hypothetical protein